MTAERAWKKKVSDTWDQASIGWERWDPLLMGSMNAVNPVLQRALGLKPGLALLDVGCGTGEPAASFAPLLEPGGRIMAIDISRGMIAAARRRMRARGIRNVRFRATDAASLDSGLRFDRIVSRYGVMFSEDSEALFARLRLHLNPRGRAAFAVWGPVAKNAYFAGVIEALQPVLKQPLPDPETIPHPMRFARAGLLERTLRRVGFRAVQSEGVHTPFTVQSPEQYADIILTVSGSTRDAVQKAGPRAMARVRAGLIRVAERYREGPVVRMPGFAWVVSARR